MQCNDLRQYQRYLQRLLMRVRPAPLASFLKRLLRIRRVTIETPHGRFWIDPVSNLGVQLSGDGTYEPGMRQILEKFLSPNSSFVDLGANEGYFTIIGAKLCGAHGRVVAIEPQLRMLPIIAENLRLNGVEYVRVLNTAVSDAPGMVSIHLASDINTGASGLHRSTKYPLPTQKVAARTLAQVLDDEGLLRVDLMKVDLEGFEYEALMGSVEVFAQHRVRALALELHPTILSDRGKEVSEITKMLCRCGYLMAEAPSNTVWLAPAGEAAGRAVGHAVVRS
jgi:FkbM family methyltransferase